MDSVKCVVSDYKKECSGCHACYDACPTGAITMEEDVEGFWYPCVNESKCIHCGRCVKVCQIFNTKKQEGTISTEAYACLNQNTEERLASSSGGLFILLAKQVLDKDGVVFGAAFDDHMELRHTYATDLGGCRAFMGSKYLQSRIGMAYADAKRFLVKGRWVLFTGTPCQIHGLKLFLGRDYEKLIAVDLACHGVPSPAVFRKYLSDLEKQQGSPIDSFNFRSKKGGWGSFEVKAPFKSRKNVKESKADNFDNSKKDAHSILKCSMTDSNPVVISPKRTAFFVDFNNVTAKEKSLEIIINPFIPKPGLAHQLRSMIPKPIKMMVKKALKKNKPESQVQRDDGISWKDYSLEIIFANCHGKRIPHGESAFMKGFLADLYLRPSCYGCRNKGEQRYSDLTLADYWGVEGRDPDMDDDQGTSAVLVHTEKGKRLLKLISKDVKTKPADLSYIYQCNPSLVKNAEELQK